MIDSVGRRALIGTVVFAVCFVILLVLRLLPLASGLTGWPGGDLALCLTLIWVQRRPEQVPALLVAVLFLLEDVALYRPLGLWAIIVLLATEAVRSREIRWREAPFLIEWLRVSILIGLMLLAFRLIQVLALIPVPALGQAILQYLATVAAYPAVALAARWLVGLTRRTSGSAEGERYGG